jgi:hypothetical protein
MKTLYVVANGPSVNKVDITSLRSKDTLSFNRAFVAYEEWGFVPTYYACIDRAMFDSVKSDIVKYLPKFKRAFIGNQPVGFFDSLGLDNISYVSITGEHGDWCKCTSTEDDSLFCFDEKLNVNKKHIHTKLHLENAGCFHFPLFYAMGYRRFVLIGCDANYAAWDHLFDKHNNANWVYKDDMPSPNHFHKDYYVKGQKTGQAIDENVKNIWGYVLKQLNKQDDIEVISSSPGGYINNFIEYKDLEVIVGEDDE